MKVGEIGPEPAKRSAGGGNITLSSTGDLESLQANQRNLAKLMEQDPANTELRELNEKVEREIQGLLDASSAGGEPMPELQHVPEVAVVAEPERAAPVAVAVAAEPEERVVEKEPARQLGRVVKFDSKKGFGFIRPEGGEDAGGGGDVFVHRKSVVMAEGINQNAALSEEQLVSFVVEVSDGRTRALDVRDPDGLPLVPHDAVLLTHLDLRAHTESWRGLKEQQEDRFVQGEDLGDLGMYYGVFDGHGGIYTPEYLAKHLHKNVVSRRVANSSWNGNEAGVKKLLVDTFNATDKEMMVQPAYKKAVDGSTALVALIQGAVAPSAEAKGDARIYVANAGDCRAVLCRAGRAVRLSEDHKPNRNDEARRIKDAGGFVVNMGGVHRVTTAAGAGAGVNLKEHHYLAVSRSFGDCELKVPKKIVTSEPEVKVVDITEEDAFVVLACDGVWDHLSDQEVVNIAGEYFGRPQDGAASVVRTAYQKGSGDNLTATVVEFAWVAPQRVKDMMSTVANEAPPEGEDLDMFGD